MTGGNFRILFVSEGIGRIGDSCPNPLNAHCCYSKNQSPSCSPKKRNRGHVDTVGKILEPFVHGKPGNG